MKIQKLLEDLIGSTKAEKQYHGSFKTEPTRRRIGDKTPVEVNTARKALGVGHFSSVKPVPNDPHLVKKHSKYVENDDGYNKFIEYLIDNDLMDNIHFPKIYNVTTITDKNGNPIHTYTMEKLISYDTASEAELEAFVNKTFSTEIVTRINDVGVHSIVEVIEGCVQSIVGTLDTIIDESFAEAIQILRNLLSNPSIYLDIKRANLMWRRTPQGLVLVFTDPVY